LLIVQGFTTFLLEHGDAPADPEINDIIYYFGSVGAAMLTLFQITTGGESWGPMYGLIRLAGPAYAAIFIFFIGFFQFAVFNILTGMFVEHAMTLAQPDKETLVFEARRKKLEDAETMKSLIRGMDTDANGRISLTELRDRLKDPKAKALLELQGLAVEDAELYFKLLSKGSLEDDVEIDAFAEGALKMKGEANSLDLQTLIYETKEFEKHHREFEKSVAMKFDSLTEMLTQMQSSMQIAQHRNMPLYRENAETLPTLPISPSNVQEPTSRSITEL
jgi:hypothetical protein